MIKRPGCTGLLCGIAPCHEVIACIADAKIAMAGLGRDNGTHEHLVAGVVADYKDGDCPVCIVNETGELVVDMRTVGQGVMEGPYFRAAHLLNNGADKIETMMYQLAVLQNHLSIAQRERHMYEDALNAIKSHPTEFIEWFEANSVPSKSATALATSAYKPHGKGPMSALKARLNEMIDIAITTRTIAQIVISRVKQERAERQRNG